MKKLILPLMLFSFYAPSIVSSISHKTNEQIICALAIGSFKVACAGRLGKVMGQNLNFYWEKGNLITPAAALVCSVIAIKNGYEDIKAAYQDWKAIQDRKSRCQIPV